MYIFKEVANSTSSLLILATKPTTTDDHHLGYSAMRGRTNTNLNRNTLHNCRILGVSADLMRFDIEYNICATLQRGRLGAP